MKGLLKGLRHISEMFEDKEPEMQIGMPTDVKHVAHIGSDGPAASKPTWMNEFNAAQELSSDALTNNLPNTSSAAGNHESLPPTSKEKKKSRRKGSIENGSGVESPSPKDSEKHSRRHRSSNHSTEPSQDLPDIPKKSRQKKSKASSGGSEGSSKSSKTKSGNSLPDLTDLES